MNRREWLAAGAAAMLTPQALHAAERPVARSGSEARRAAV